MRKEHDVPCDISTGVEFLSSDLVSISSGTGALTCPQEMKLVGKLFYNYLFQKHVLQKH